VISGILVSISNNTEIPEILSLTIFSISSPGVHDFRILTPPDFSGGRLKTKIPEKCDKIQPIRTYALNSLRVSGVEHSVTCHKKVE